jgi:histidyl-tRNA synthetase
MIKVVRGMRDLFGAEIATWHRLEDIFRSLPARFGYQEFRTPIVESADLFRRGVGEETDIVGKEMYTFEDRGGDSLTLRPEMTAPIVRAAIEHTLLRHQPTTRLWYYGPLFRYERPQKGRYRQFHQFGAELLGSPHPEADAEIIMLAAETIREVGLQNITLQINTLGISEERSAYRAALVSYLEDHVHDLSEDSKRRLQHNPLRVLDSKDEGDRRIVVNAPVLFNYLEAASKQHFETVLAILSSAGISFTIEHRLVRGLDYYSHTVFEFVSNDLGAQNTVCGGGRYDPLFALLGGGDVPAVGFSFGVERLVLLMEELASKGSQGSEDLYICAINEEARLPAQLLALRLRRAGFVVHVDVQRRSMKAQMKEADKIGVRATLVLGEEELRDQTVTIKDMVGGQQTSVPLSQLESHLHQALKA